MKFPISIHCITPNHFELHWPNTIDPDILIHMASVRKTIEMKWADEMLNIISSYCILGLNFKNPENKEVIQRELTKLIKNQQLRRDLVRFRWTIPVCYDFDLAPDLETYLKKKQMDRDTFVHIHSMNNYLLYFYGFLPGFMYLGGMDQRLSLSRKAFPDRNIEKGAVAIGGNQTGVYPGESPGGWHVIGKTPIEIFHPKKSSPFQIADYIRFEPIGKKQFFEIGDNNDYQLKKERMNG
ncbi:MAG: carboxyltransferase domain-containing protein [Cyclobacteriaceae bacterium]